MIVKANVYAADLHLIGLCMLVSLMSFRPREQVINMSRAQPGINYALLVLTED